VRSLTNCLGERIIDPFQLLSAKQQSGHHSVNPEDEDLTVKVSDADDVIGVARRRKSGWDRGGWGGGYGKK
jgi:hypothetical protein